MTRKNILNGIRFGRLLVMSEDVESKSKKTRWICKCDCGNVKSILGEHLTRTKQPVRSCGCLAIDMLKERSIKHNVFVDVGEYYKGVTTDGLHEFYFDKDDYEKVKDFCWRYKQDKSPYMITSVTDEMADKYKFLKPQQVIYLHRFICDCYVNDELFKVDHKSRNTLDNRKSNLRPSETNTNAWNSVSHRGIFRGINLTKSGMYRVRIMKDGLQHELGIFCDLEEAIKERIKKEKELYGSFAPNRDITCGRPIGIEKGE